MNKRSMTAWVLALVFLAVSGGVAFAQDQLPPGWVHNWDGSNTYVFLGSPGTGNVGYQPGNFDIPQSEYSRRHPGWYDELVGQITDDWYQQNRDRAGDGWDRLSPDEEGRVRPGQRLDPGLRGRMHWAPAELSQRYNPPPSGYRYAVIGGQVLLVDNDYMVQKVYRVNIGTRGGGRTRVDVVETREPVQGRLPRGWVQNWDGSGTYVFLGSPGTGNVGRQPGNFDIPQATYSRRHPGWYDQLVGQVTQDWYRENRDRAGPGWRDRLSPAEERRIRRGQRLDAGMRQRVHWVPADLAQRYNPPPSGYRYGVVGGRVLLLDNNYQVYGVFKFNIGD